MATFKMGAIVTEIVGSIGGTTFKRHGNSRIIMNKSNGSTNNRLLQNKALSYLGSIFKSWSTLSVSEQAGWNAQALLFQFPDKFGTMRNLSGRQLYIKLNSQNYKISPYPIVSAGVNSTLVPFVIQYFVYNSDLNESQFAIDRESGGQETFLFSLEFSTQPLHSPTFISRKTFYMSLQEDDFAGDLLPLITSFYPNWKASDNTRLYVQSVNASGFKSVMQYIDMSVIRVP